MTDNVTYLSTVHGALAAGLDGRITDRRRAGSSSSVFEDKSKSRGLSATDGSGIETSDDIGVTFWP